MRVYLTERKQQQQQQQLHQQQQQQSVKRQQLYRVQSARLVLSVLFGFGNDDDSFLMVMIDKGAGTHQYKHIIITHTQLLCAMCIIVLIAIGSQCERTLIESEIWQAANDNRSIN